VVTEDAEGVQPHQYAPSTVRTSRLSFEVETACPDAGDVTVRIAASGGEPVEPGPR